MPELPEVETVRRTLVPLVGAKIRGVWDSGQGLHMRRKPPRKRLQHLVGATLTEMRRWGKYLLIDTDTPYTLLIQLGMTGRVLITPASAPRPKHTHLVLDLGDRELRFTDPRRFGQIDIVERPTRGQRRSPPAAARAVRRPRRPRRGLLSDGPGRGVQPQRRAARRTRSG